MGFNLAVRACTADELMEGRDLVGSFVVLPHLGVAEIVVSGSATVDLGWDFEFAFGPGSESKGSAC